MLLAGCTLLYPNVPNWNVTPTPEVVETITATLTVESSLQTAEVPAGHLRASQANLVRLAMITGQTGWGIANDAVLHTDYGGSFWLPVTPQGVDEVGWTASSFFLDEATGWVLIPDREDFTQGVLYRSTDSGASWQSSTVPFSNASFSFIDQQVGWAMFSSGAAAGSSVIEIYQSSDGGQTWSQIYAIDPASSQDDGNIPFSGSKSGITFLNMERGWVTGDVPADGFIYVYMSTDGGQTWDQQELKLPAGMENSQISFRPPVFFSNRNGKLFTYMYGPQSAAVIYTSNDGGINWKPTTPIQTNGLISFPSMQAGFVWDGGPALFGTLDGGLTWLQVTPNFTPGQNLVQIEFANSQLGWALVDDGSGHNQLYQTIEAGYSWQLLP